MLRSILLPTLVACFIAVPLLYQKSTTRDLSPQIQSVPNAQNVRSDYDFYVSQPTEANLAAARPYSPPHANSSYNPRQTSSANRSLRPDDRASTVLTASTALTVTPDSTLHPILNRASQNPQATHRMNLPQLSEPSLSPKSLPVLMPSSTSGGNYMTASSSQIPLSPTVNFNQMTPDYGAVQTQTFRGNAFGPDLTTEPMQFVPVSNFQEIFRFNVSPAWAKQRWERLTAIPAENGLHGLRTALVTGTNSWDLNGALTYHFDQNHRTQRITFRGWVGDPSRLINLVTQHFGFKPQPTHWAGLYVATFDGEQTGGLLMKDPDTIDRRNQVQRTAVIMEINQPSGRFKLSDEFVGFMAPAMPGH